MAKEAKMKKKMMSKPPMSIYTDANMANGRTK